MLIEVQDLKSKATVKANRININNKQNNKMATYIFVFWASEKYLESVNYKLYQRMTVKKWSSIYLSLQK